MSDSLSGSVDDSMGENNTVIRRITGAFKATEQEGVNASRSLHAS